MMVSFVYHFLLIGDEAIISLFFTSFLQFLVVFKNSQARFIAIFKLQADDGHLSSFMF
jgi:hypothetical protein